MYLVTSNNMVNWVWQICSVKNLERMYLSQLRTVLHDKDRLYI